MKKIIFNPLSVKFDYIDTLSAQDFEPYEKLDGTNQPSTGNKEISKSAPKITLKDTTNNYITEFYRDNTTIKISGDTLQPPGDLDYCFDTAGSRKGTLANSSGMLNGDNTHSISMWIRLNSVPSSTAMVFVSRLLSGISGDRRLNGIHINSSGSVLYAWNGTTMTSSVTLSANQWYHICVISNGGSGKKLYINGVERATTTNTASPSVNDSWYINTSAYDNSILTARVDELIVWDRAISVGDVATLYNSGNGWRGNLSLPPTNTGVIAAFHLDENTGTTGADYSGNSRNITFSSALWAEGVIQPVYTKFNSDFITITDGATNPEKATMTVGQQGSVLILKGFRTEFYNGANEVFEINDDGELVFPDNYHAYFGTGKDASIQFDATQLIITGIGQLKDNNTGVKILEASNLGRTFYDASDIAILNFGQSGSGAKWNYLAGIAGILKIDADGLMSTDTNTYLQGGGWYDAEQNTINLSSFNNDLTYITDLSTFTTDNLAEGTTNLYASDTNLNTWIATKTTDDLAQGSTNLYCDSTNVNSALATLGGYTGDLNDSTSTKIADVVNGLITQVYY